jgi:hypothetical protein
LARISCTALIAALIRPSPTLVNASLYRPRASSAPPTTNRVMVKKEKTLVRRIRP